MPEQPKKKKALKRTLKTLLTCTLVALAAWIAWVTLAPMLTANAITTYDSYTVATGDIQTEKSFSASLDVKKSESFKSEEECTVRAIYVQSGDTVKKGDALMLLSTGEVFYASFDGVVNEIRVDVGDWLWPNFNAVQICDLVNLEVSLYVDEYDIHELSLGQSCTVRIISLGQDYDTVIAHINRVSQSQNSVAFFAVTCDLTAPENVLPGMQATVTIPSTAVQGVLTLPMAALSFDDDRNPYVLVKDASGAYAQTPVETGLTDGMTIEIRSGLSEGQTVYVVSGTESAEASVTLDTLYQAIFGKTVIINDASDRQGGGGQNGEGMPSFGEGGAAPGGDTAGTLPAQGDTAAVSTGDATGAADAAGVAPAATAGTAASVSPDATPAADATASATAAQGGTGGPPSGGSGGPGAPGSSTDAGATATQTPTATQEEETSHVE
ncbi:MAG: HlyD family efflux transporter periplasmic adaptor subunit [Candidatus Limiplasma sp.]|nr:HlyD family efflux transporter periplasmic adaptor subunit [Candidatus Limiplasma sp.]